MEEKLKKIETLIYVIIAILLVDTIALFATFKDTTTDEKTTTNTNAGNEVVNTSYDVSKMKEITVEEFESAIKDDDREVVYFGRKTCSHCVNFVPKLNQASEEYGYQTLYVDMDKVTEDEYYKIFELLGDFASEGFGTPTVAILDDGEIKDVNIGETSYEGFASFLEKNGFEK